MSTSPTRTLVVCVISEVETERQAASQAKQALSRVVESTRRPVESFSEVDIFEGDAREMLTLRWGEYPRAVRLESEQADELLSEAFSKMDQKFEENLNSVRAILDWYSDEQIQTNAELIRDRFLSVGAYVGQSIHVYGDKGRPIRSRPEFDEYVESREDLWVVPAVARQ